MQKKAIPNERKSFIVCIRVHTIYKKIESTANVSVVRLLVMLTVAALVVVVKADSCKQLIDVV